MCTLHSILSGVAVFRCFVSEGFRWRSLLLVVSKLAADQILPAFSD